MKVSPEIEDRILNTPGVKVNGAMKSAVELELPYPPSLNRYYRRVGAKTLISKGGRQYRHNVFKEVISALGAFPPPFKGRLRVELRLSPPDRRRRDVDNALKAVLDAMQHAGVYEDDSQIDDLRIVRGSVVPGGRLTAVIRPM